MADGWFDIMRPDLDHKFKSYKRNVPMTTLSDRHVSELCADLSLLDESESEVESYEG